MCSSKKIVQSEPVTRQNAKHAARYCKFPFLNDLMIFYRFKNCVKRGQHNIGPYHYSGNTSESPIFNFCLNY
jgi:hypothetical protein